MPRETWRRIRRPHHNEIAFARLDETRTDIYVAAAPGGSEQRLAEFPPARVHTILRGVADPFLSWSPDGQWLVISGLRASDTSAIYLVAHDGSDRRTLLPGAPTTDYTAAAFSPQGNALAYVDSGFLGIVEVDPRNPSNITKAPRRLTDYQGYVGGLAWTPDGKRILYRPGGLPRTPALLSLEHRGRWVLGTAAGRPGRRCRVSGRLDVRAGRIQPTRSQRRHVAAGGGTQ